MNKLETFIKNHEKTSLTYNDLADFYNLKHNTNGARTGSMNKMYEWALKQEEITTVGSKGHLMFKT